MSTAQLGKSAGDESDPELSHLQLGFPSSSTSGCPWPKDTVKSPVGARDLRPVQPPRTLSAFMFGFVARFG
jgi:hypothetical protein